MRILHTSCGFELKKHSMFTSKLKYDNRAHTKNMHTVYTVFCDGFVLTDFSIITQGCCTDPEIIIYYIYINGLVQERCNSSAYALELCLSCTNPLIWKYILNTLIHYGLVMPYGVIKSGTKPLPEPLLANPQWGLLSFTCGQLYRKCFGTFPWYKGSVSSLPSACGTVSFLPFVSLYRALSATICYGQIDKFLIIV